jgi:tetratricopeptide (TPR) repeat protein
MDEALFQGLLGSVEGETLDFKAKAYQLSEDADKFALVKDVLCMANTPRDDPAYIVLGVKKHPDGRYELLGVQSHLDDADLQSQFTQRVYPLPVVRYEPFEFQGRSFGVIHVLPERVGPCVPIKEVPNILRERQVYIRRGSKNDVATPEDLLKIAKWVRAPDALIAARDVAGGYGDNLWRKFVEAAHGFESGRRYVLLSALGEIAFDQNASVIGELEWSLVLDWDPESDQSGLLSLCRRRLQERRNLVLVVAGDRVAFDPVRATYWLFARGLVGRQETLAIGPWRAWQQRYGLELKEQLTRFAKASNPSPVTIVALWFSNTLADHLNSVLETALACLGDSMECVLVCEDPANVHSVTAKFAVDVVPMPLEHLCAGLETIVPRSRATAESPRIPSGTKGVSVAVEKEDMRWIEQEIEVTHLGLGRTPPEGPPLGQEFLRGSEIDWYELGLHYDVDRETTRPVADRVESDLQRRRATRVNLYHAPGAGGTTVARRILWDLHDKFPCGILHRTEPTQTVERLSNLARITRQSLFLVIDGSEISEREVDTLFDLLRARHLPVVCLQVLRRFGKQKEGERSFNLPSELTDTEASRLALVLSREVPEQRSNLEKLVRSSDPRMRNAFFFGLQAFGRDFRGLGKYVQSRLESLNTDQRELVGLLAMAHHYAQRPVPSQAFCHLLQIPPRRKVDLKQVLPESATELLTEVGENRWRTAHDLIAVEIMEQLLSGPTGDRRTWKQGLSTWAKDFARVCRGADAVPSGELTELVRRAFVYRDNVELLGTERAGSKRFSQLLEDIPSEEGALDVLRDIVALYPEEAHFWAHLGRYLATKRNDYEDANRCLEHAVSLSERDHVLHHMAGMCARAQVYDLLEKGTPAADCIPLVKRASACFATARELNPEDEHGYISEVQMLIRVLDSLRGKRQASLGQVLLSPGTEPLLRESFQHAEDLLEQVRKNREGEGPSPFEEQCRAQLHALYGRFDQALNAWSSLLTRKDVYAPPMRRQVVWTYLSSHNHSWDALSPGEAKHAVELLEQNLREEPNEERNLRLWLQAVRRLATPPSLEAVLEKIAYWSANTGSIESAYYLYVLNALLVLEGSTIATNAALGALDKCRTLARFRRNRTRSYEWLGRGTGLSALVHHSRLGEWRRDKEFWANTTPLFRVAGRIARIMGPEAGEVEAPGGLKAFFVPGRAGLTEERFINRAVDFYLGFSYDGLRAWDVRETDGSARQTPP